VLTDLALSADGVELYDLQPHDLPDLFGGDELVVFGRMRGEATGERLVTMTSRRNGREERFSTAVRLETEQPDADYIQQLWAARKAGALSSEIRLHGPNEEIVSELKRLALRYGILTEYTSYLVQEPGGVVQRPDEIRPMPRDQVGAGAVLRSEAARKLASSYNLDAVTVTGAGAVEADSVTAAERGRTSRTQRSGGRVFVWRDSVWTDIAHGDSLPVVRVAVFSDAYFALLRALPELRQPATLEPAVLLAGRRVSIEILAGGKTTWAAGELAALVRDFRS
jgi:Ca-activated chloride channel family protein